MKPTPIWQTQENVQGTMYNVRRADKCHTRRRSSRVLHPVLFESCEVSSCRPQNVNKRRFSAHYGAEYYNMSQIHPIEGTHSLQRRFSVQRYYYFLTCANFIWFFCIFCSKGCIRACFAPLTTWHGTRERGRLFLSAKLGGHVKAGGGDTEGCLWLSCGYLSNITIT